MRANGTYTDLSASLPIATGGGPGSAEGGAAYISIGTTVEHARLMREYGQASDFLLLVSVAIQEPDALLAAEIDATSVDLSSLRAVDIPGYELRRVCAGTVTGVNSSGALTYSEAEAGFPTWYTIIDETAKLYAEAQALTARGDRNAVSVSWTDATGIQTALLPGGNFSSAILCGVSTPCECIVATVEWDFQSGTTSYSAVPINATEAIG